MLLSSKTPIKYPCGLLKQIVWPIWVSQFLHEGSMAGLQVTSWDKVIFVALATDIHLSSPRRDMVCTWDQKIVDRPHRILSPHSHVT